MKLSKLMLMMLLAGATVGLAACGGGGTTVAPPTGAGGGDDDDDDDDTPTDPYLVSTLIADSGSNVTDMDPMLNTTAGADPIGYPTGSSPDFNDAAFAVSAPSVWPGVGGEPVPAYIVDTQHIGAFDPDAATPWTDEWTIYVNGNDAVWEPAAGGTLAGGVPVADGNCPAGTTDIGNFGTLFGPMSGDEEGLIAAGDMDVCVLPDRVTSNLTLTNDNVYKVGNGFPGTLVGDGEGELADAGAVAGVSNVVLTVEPGTLIYGGNQEALVITRGSRLEAVGTAADPIVLTSSNQLSGRFDGSGTSPVDTGRGEWAGLALMGFAPSNECGAGICNVAAEGNVGNYGGDDESDDSGTLNYVIVRNAGNDIDGQGNELNGISYFGTGSGTESNFIQVHKNLDDGIEHFGSNDFVGHAVLTLIGDDSVDWGQGWIGGAQHVLVVQGTDAGDHGIEADNDGDNPELEPISYAWIANATFIGQDNTDTGILLRRGTRAQIWNTIVTGSPRCLDLDDDATFNRAPSGTQTSEMAFENDYFSCATTFVEE